MLVTIPVTMSPQFIRPRSKMRLPRCRQLTRQSGTEAIFPAFDQPRSCAKAYLVDVMLLMREGKKKDIPSSSYRPPPFRSHKTSIAKMRNSRNHIDDRGEFDVGAANRLPSHPWGVAAQGCPRLSHLMKLTRRSPEPPRRRGGETGRFTVASSFVDARGVRHDRGDA